MFHLDIHAWIEAQQTSHGVRHDDYAQYHAYCTRRLARLSHEKEAKQYLVHSNKFASPLPDAASSTENSANQNSKSDKESKKKKKSAGSRHAFCTRSHDTFALVKEDENGDPVGGGAPVQHVNILWYLLVSAERSWAHSNQLQKSGTAKRQQVLKKLKRATEWADLLLKKAKVSADTASIKECEAYCAWMSANYAMEKFKYHDASQQFARAMTLCFDLSEEDSSLELAHEQLDGDNDQVENEAARRLERHDLFVTRAETVLRPLFRYCQYELKQAGEATMDEPRLRQSQNGESVNEASDDNAVIFRDQELVLESKQLRVLLLKLQSLDNETKDSSTDNETQFLTALSILDDALDVVHSLENGLSKLNSGPAVQAKLHQYALWKGYLQYTKTRKVMEHTESLLVSESEEGGSPMGPAEKAHVYDALLQHARSLLALPRPGQESPVSEEDEFALQVQANILRLRALKTFQMGWYYYTRLRKYAAAFALMEHSAHLCKRAQEEIAACDEDMPHCDEYLAELEGLPHQSAMAAIRAAHALQQRQHTRKLKSVGANDSSSAHLKPITTDRPLLLRLYDMDSGSPDAPIAELRPIPLPCKPVFYDLAYNYAIDPSNSIDAVEDFVHEHTISRSSEEDDTNEAPDRGGTGGFFGWLTGN
ncbi:RNA-binding signal recognition particle 68 [Nitzschia inconspicua]|uniref:RNA-binding signal recognition particle 68 n=1 Tax=Nitzschia inconspicua TaxID=303405 RepID=A0A9K3L4V6_9STRA|nr:RNA-binding signal recognition particle 68 [Nitzschia inconspicua]